MKITALSAEDAEKAKKRKLLRPAPYDAFIREADEGESQTGKDRIHLVVVVRDGDGLERVFHDYLSDAAIAAAKVRSACVAVNALDKYSSGTIGPDDFAGQAVRVHVGTEKRRGWPERNIITRYEAPSSAAVVNLRKAGG